MISKSSDGKFDISEFDYAGMGDEKNCVGVNFRAKKGILITLIDVAKACTGNLCCNNIKQQQNL